MSNTAEVIQFNPNKITAFDEFTAQLSELKQNNGKLKFDYEDPKGNKEARSHIYKLRQTKSAVESARKQAKDSALQYGREVDAKAKDIKAEIEEMIAVHETPLKEIEEREAARIQAHKDRLAEFEVFKDLPMDANSDQIGFELGQVESVVIDDSFEEFKSAAAIAKDVAVTELKRRLESRKQYEAEQAELERLRKEKEERDRKDREEQIAREAADRAMKEAEEREARAAKEREEKAERERLEREKQEAERKAELERAQREAAEAERRAAQAEKLAKEQAERELKERQDAEMAERERREADKKHREKVNKAAADAIEQHTANAAEAMKIVTAIAEGEIPGVTINY